MIKLGPSPPEPFIIQKKKKETLSLSIIKKETHKKPSGGPWAEPWVVDVIVHPKSQEGCETCMETNKPQSQSQVGFIISYREAPEAWQLICPNAPSFVGNLAHPAASPPPFPSHDAHHAMDWGLGSPSNRIEIHISMLFDWIINSDFLPFLVERSILRNTTDWKKKWYDCNIF